MGTNWNTISARSIPETEAQAAATLRRRAHGSNRHRAPRTSAARSRTGAVAARS
jgi:hypothetical protein